MKESRKPRCMPVTYDRVKLRAARGFKWRYFPIYTIIRLSYWRSIRRVNQQPYLETTISWYWYCHCTASCGGLGIQRCNVKRLRSMLGFAKRKSAPYDWFYDRLNFDVPVGPRRDCYDRYWIRIGEEDKVFDSLRMSQSNDRKLRPSGIWNRTIHGIFNLTFWTWDRRPYQLLLPIQQ